MLQPNLCNNLNELSLLCYALLTNYSDKSAVCYAIRYYQVGAIAHNISHGKRYSGVFESIGARVRKHWLDLARR